ncbi:hypothetical protein Pfo_007278, partial [Paulownia fortunei]
DEMVQLREEYRKSQAHTNTGDDAHILDDIHIANRVCDQDFGIHLGYMCGLGNRSKLLRSTTSDAISFRSTNAVLKDQLHMIQDKLADTRTKLADTRIELLVYKDRLHVMESQ